MDMGNSMNKVHIRVSSRWASFTKIRDIDEEYGAIILDVQR